MYLERVQVYILKHFFGFQNLINTNLGEIFLLSQLFSFFIVWEPFHSVRNNSVDKSETRIVKLLKNERTCFFYISAYVL